MSIVADPDSWSQTALDLETAERELRTAFAPILNQTPLDTISRSPVDKSLYWGGAYRNREIGHLLIALRAQRGLETSQLRRTAADYRETEQAAIDAATGISHELGLRIE